MDALPSTTAGVSNTAPVGTNPDPKPVALIFIHGVGVQDRYQQLVAFTQGLAQTATGGEFRVSYRDEGERTPCDQSATTADLPKARFIPLCIALKDGENGRLDGHEQTAVDVHEVYWAPLLNGHDKTITAPKEDVMHAGASVGY